MTDFDWAEFLNTARMLMDGSTEADKRSAISRAYYAAFNVAKNYVVKQAEWKIARTGEDHAIVPEYLKCVIELRVCGYKLESLRQKRNDADYDACQFKNADLKTKLAVEDAAQIIAQISLLL